MGISTVVKDKTPAEVVAGIYEDNLAEVVNNTTKVRIETVLYALIQTMVANSDYTWHIVTGGKVFSGRIPDRRVFIPYVSLCPFVVGICYRGQISADQRTGEIVFNLGNGSVLSV